LSASDRQCVDGIKQETEALGRVVTNFLNYARPEQVTLTRVSLAPLAQRTADELRHELPASTAIEVRGVFGDIDGDEVLLRQVLANLLRNAAEACEGAGRVPAIVLEGGVDQAERTCRVTIADNGPGIPEALRLQVFQPFFTTRAQGTGLGLAIVRKIVVMHNGRVVVNTSAAGGAAIELTFPTAATP
jgi:signal transduction histidine kinase